MRALTPPSRNPRHRTLDPQLKAATNSMSSCDVGDLCWAQRPQIRRLAALRLEGFMLGCLNSLMELLCCWRDIPTFHVCSWPLRASAIHATRCLEAKKGRNNITKPIFMSSNQNTGSATWHSPMFLDACLEFCKVYSDRLILQTSF